MQDDNSDDDSTQAPLILGRIDPSGPRRVIGTTVPVLLGLGLLWIGLNHPAQALGWTVFLVAFGAVAIWAAVRLWQSSSVSLILTATALTDSTGRHLVDVTRIVGVDRGALAFKPANGFILRCDRADRRAWAPGLWWRIGRRVGVGGVVPADQARAMAETIAGLIAARNPSD